MISEKLANFHQSFKGQIKQQYAPDRMLQAHLILKDFVDVYLYQNKGLLEPNELEEILSYCMHLTKEFCTGLSSPAAIIWNCDNTINKVDEYLHKRSFSKKINKTKRKF